MSSVKDRLKKIRHIRDRLTKDLGDNLTQKQITYLYKICDKLLQLAKKEPVTHGDIDITMAMLSERHEHYKELNRDREE
jgi:hypothetical protein